MRLSLDGFRGALLAALGVTACGPGVANDDDGSGSQTGSGSSGPGTSGPSTTVDATTIDATTVDATSVDATTVDATSADGTTGTGSYCNEDPPADPAPQDSCANPMPLLQLGPDGMVPSGYVRCDSGMVHREEKLACIYYPDPSGPCGLPDDPASECAVAADCAAEPNGHCVVEGMDGGCSCRYACETDEDCGDGSVCFCNGGFTECVSAACTTDADCGGYQCAYDYSHGFACQTPFDECRSDSECAGAECPDCAPDSAACAWTCQPSDFGCTSAGRPLLVGGHEVRAPLVVRGDWRGEAKASIASAIDRARLAAHWRDAALMEHASVGAFARFALQLLALGAPPDLLADTAAAMQDEIEHARVMFALAAADGDDVVGPGALPIAAVMDETIDLVVVARSVAYEACIGETLAAVELAEAALHAECSERRALLGRIADDELRHAALGWRFLRWALAQASTSERLAIVDALDTAIDEAAARTSAGTDGLRAHGVLDAALATRCRRDAIASIVRPLADVLAQRGTSDRRMDPASVRA